MKGSKLTKVSRRELLDLHFKLCRKQGPYSHTTAARRYWDKYFREVIRKAERGGVIEVLEGKNKVSAAFLLWHEKSRLTGARLLHGIALCEPKSKPARKWLSEVARRHRKKFILEMHFVLLNTNRFLVNDLESCGLYLNDVLLLGSVNKALSRLAEKYPEVKRAPPAFSIQPIRTRRQVQEALQIFKDEFGRNPQFGWFCPRPGFLKFMRQLISDSMKSRLPFEFMFEKEGRLFAQFGHSRAKYYPHLKSHRVGVGLTFHKDVQGRGLAKYAYYHVLKLAKKRGYKYFFGGTAQRPVMHLGKLMGRQAVMYVLNGHRFFDRSHFLY